MSIFTKTKNLATFKFNNSKQCCIAPYSTLNFDTMGYMRVCCYNNYFLLGKYPDVSLKDAWNNPKRHEFINNLKNLNFPKGCETCKMQVMENNIKNALFTGFDQYDKILDNEAPVVFNFDFGNICNYECIMCGGKWSSSIRKNREKLPPLKSPYDDSFVDQLSEYIPTMKIVNFLGGEPFLNSIYYKIWDMLQNKNPNIDIYITTNGSIYNSRIEEYLLKFPNLKIIVSLDSLIKETYQYIRKNGNFDTVMENIEKFKKLGKFSSIAFCPMIQNVRELPSIIQFCINNDIDLGINEVTEHLGGKIKGIHEGETKNVMVWTGADETKQVVNVNNEELIPEVALKTLPKEELQNIVSYLKKYSFESHPKLNEKYQSFINSLTSKSS